jgi:hypothetical protein
MADSKKLTVSQKRIINEIIEDLGSSDDKIVLDALKRVRAKGNPLVIPTIIKTFQESDSEKVQIEIKNILSELKSKDAVEPLIESLDEADGPVKELILYGLWNSNLNPIEHIAKIVDVSCKGDYMVALEGLTIIENLEGPFDEVVINDTKLILNDYFGQKEDEKTPLIASILGFVQQFESFLINE